MEENRTALSYGTAAFAFIALVSMLAAPFLTVKSAVFTEAPTYLKLIGAFADALSGAKNTALALTMFSMVAAFLGMLLAVSLLFVPKSFGKATLYLYAVTAGLGLVPVLRVLLEGFQPLEAVGYQADGFAFSALGAGYYLTGICLFLVCFLSAWQLLPAEFPQKESEPMPQRAPARRKDVSAGKARAAKRAPEAPAPARPARAGDAPLSLSPTPSPSPSPTPSPAPVGGYIEGGEGMYRGMRFHVDVGESVVFGRNRHYANVVITQGNDFISRRHCAVCLTPAGEYRVTDYSKNGTFVGPAAGSHGARLPHNVPTVLPKGSVIRLGMHPNDFRLN